MRLSEEMQIYLEVSRNCQKIFAERIEIARDGGELLNETALKRQISGEVTESAIREHLISNGVRMSQTQVFIGGVKDPIDLLSLRSAANIAEKRFSPEEIDTVLEITNTAVGDKSTRIDRKFGKIRRVSEAISFAVIVLSERKRYSNAVVQERLRKDFNCKVYTLLVRDHYINPFDWSERKILGEYERKNGNGNSAIMETGDWRRVLDFLLHKYHRLP